MLRPRQSAVGDAQQKATVTQAAKKPAPFEAGLSVLDITAVPRYARATSTVMPSDVRLLMGITSFTLNGLQEFSASIRSAA